MKQYINYAFIWLKHGNVNKAISCLNRALEMRQVAAIELHCDRLIRFCSEVRND